MKGKRSQILIAYLLTAALAGSGVALGQQPNAVNPEIAGATARDDRIQQPILLGPSDVSAGIAAEDCRGELMSKIRVAVNGYGVIGRRVVDAVAFQEDMEMVGIADVVGDYRLRRAQARGFAIYTALAEKQDDMNEASIDVRGTLDDLLNEAEVVVDCTPKGIDARNKPRYASLRSTSPPI